MKVSPASLQDDWGSDCPGSAAAPPVGNSLPLECPMMLKTGEADDIRDTTYINMSERRKRLKRT